jgi:Uncharacterized protein conserved in bacteria (DUF2188)
MTNETRDNQNTEDEGGFEGVEYNQRASDAGRSAQGAIEVEDRQAAGAGIEGEGSYEGARSYEQRLKEFVRSGRVEQAANDAELALDSDLAGHAQAERQGKAGASGLDAGDDVAVHVHHERTGWVVEHGTGKGPAATFDSIDDALRRAHELAAEQHLPLFVHGPDGELIDKYDAL